MKDEKHKLSHEIRTNFSVIVSGINLLRRSDNLRADNKSILDAMDMNIFEALSKLDLILKE
jgi:hypothetical protein